jgi:hypothetical protein
MQAQVENHADKIEAQKWWKEAVIYQIYPRSLKTAMVTELVTLKESFLN